MLKRLFWLSLGVALGIFAFRKLSQAQNAVTPSGINRAVGRAADRASFMGDVFRNSMNAREAELRDALGLKDKD